MKNLLKMLSFIALVAFVLASCDKVDDLPNYESGNAPALTANKATVSPLLSEAATPVVTFSWTNPKYATDTANVKYLLQIDSAGKNFSKPLYSKEVTAQNSLSLKGEEVTKLLVDAGYAYNTLYDLDVRVSSSYINNNNPLFSNILKVKMSAYVTPPKVQLPSTNRLFIVGSASAGGWNTPVPTPSQEFARLDSVTYSGVFDMSGNNEFLVLEEANSFNVKYSLANNSLPGVNQAGDFGRGLNDNFKGPSNAGWYKITLDFQRGKYTISPYVGPQIPSNLFIVGDASPGGWNNPVPVPTQQFTRKNSVQFELASINLTSTKEYLLLPVNGDWSNKYAVTSTSAANALQDYLGYNLGSNFPAPAVTGNYKMEVNFALQKKDAAGIEQTNSALYKNTKL